MVLKTVFKSLARVQKCLQQQNAVEVRAAGGSRGTYRGDLGGGLTDDHPRGRLATSFRRSAMVHFPSCHSYHLSLRSKMFFLFSFRHRQWDLVDDDGNANIEEWSLKMSQWLTEGPITVYL